MHKKLLVQKITKEPQSAAAGWHVHVTKTSPTPGTAVSWQPPLSEKSFLQRSGTPLSELTTAYAIFSCNENPNVLAKKFSTRTPLPWSSYHTAPNFRGTRFRGSRNEKLFVETIFMLRGNPIVFYKRKNHRAYFSWSQTNPWKRRKLCALKICLYMVAHIA